MKMKIEEQIVLQVQEAFMNLFGQHVPLEKLQLQKTKKEFQGDYTLVVFPLLRFSGKPAEVTAEEVGSFLVSSMNEISEYQVVKGFLNLSLSHEFWLGFFASAKDEPRLGMNDRGKGARVVLEFSSPNTNKPLHLGHIRNNLLGASLALLLEANGYKVEKVNLVNDRGIHICKSMLAWQKWGEGKTPADTGEKGDHLVGDYYVLFDKHYRQQVAELIEAGHPREHAEKNAPLLLEAQGMLLAWEQADNDVLELWRKMNSWVYEGFAVTYERLGISFNKTYYESDTYLSGKRLVEEGLQAGVLLRRDDGSVWCPLQAEGVDEKLLLRADGTSVYMTQDLGTAATRYEEYQPEKLIYVVGNEQNYHFDVLKLILKKLGKVWHDRLYHFSYGMVELPEGKMKSREGKVIDADDLLEEMYQVARQTSEELGKSEPAAAGYNNPLYWMLALGALKYFILKVDPKKNMVFNPAESIDFNGNTGPFIQYTHARIQSLARKAGNSFSEGLSQGALMQIQLHEQEVVLLRAIHQYPAIIAEAGDALSPALLANYLFQLAKDYNHYYQTVPVLRADSDWIVSFRLGLSLLTGRVLQSGMRLLGIEVPDKM